MKHTAISEQAVEALGLLLSAANSQYSEVTHKDMAGKRWHGKNVFYHENKICSIWGIDDGGTPKYHVYTTFLSDDEKNKAIEMPKGAKRDHIDDMNGEKCFIHQDGDGDYKWVCDSMGELKSELENIIHLASGLDRKLN